jgi:hypothetical protein
LNSIGTVADPTDGLTGGAAGACAAAAPAKPERAAIRIKSRVINSFPAPELVGT